MTQVQAQRIAWGVGGLGVIGTVLGWTTETAAFPHAWLAALVAWLGWPLGCLGLILIHSLTGGRWGYALRPQLAAGAGTVWLLIPAAIPWLLVLPQLYPWSRSDPGTPLANSFYLNRPFFFGRLAVYLIAWLSLRLLVLRALRSAAPDAALARIAPAGLIVLALTITFSAIDFTMSMDPAYNSSVYGLMTMTQMGLFALSVATFVAAVGTSAPLAGETLATLGKLLLGLTLLWAYLDFMQLLIGWQSDLPDDARWYLMRSNGGWGVTTTLISITHFALPLCALIWPQVRRSRAGIAWVAGLLALSEIGRSWWLVVPASGMSFGPVDIAAMLCLLAIGAALGQQHGR